MMLLAFLLWVLLLAVPPLFQFFLHFQEQHLFQLSLQYSFFQFFYLVNLHIVYNLQGLHVYFFSVLVQMSFFLFLVFFLQFFFLLFHLFLLFPLLAQHYYRFYFLPFFLFFSRYLFQPQFFFLIFSQQILVFPQAFLFLGLGALLRLVLALLVVCYLLLLLLLVLQPQGLPLVFLRLVYFLPFFLYSLYSVFKAKISSLGDLK